MDANAAHWISGPPHGVDYFGGEVVKHIKKTIAAVAIAAGLAIGSTVAVPTQTTADTGWGQIVAPGDQGTSTPVVTPPRGKKYAS